MVNKFTSLKTVGSSGFSVKAKPKKAKPKKKTVAQEAECCAVLLQRLVRLKAADDNGYCTCVTCGIRKHYKEMEGGHYIPRKQTATKLMEENVHPQCSSCNGFGMKYGTANAQYAIYMLDMYGREFVENLLVLAKKTIKWNRFEISALIEHFKEGIKFHEERLKGV